MVQATEDRQRLLIRYLLGDLDDEQQRLIEDRYFVDDDFYTQLLVTEDELIDLYVQEDLSRVDRKKFEQVYLSNPHRQKKVESNRTLLRSIDRLAPSESRWVVFKRSLGHVFSARNISLNYSLAGVLLVGALCALACWTIMDRRRMAREEAQARSQWQQKESDYQRQLAALKGSSPASGESPIKAPEAVKPNVSRTVKLGTPVIVFALGPGVARTLVGNDGSLKPLVIPRGAVLVRLKVDLERNDYGFYSVHLQKLGGREGWRQVVARSSSESLGNQINVEVPSAFFQSGDYILKVTGSNAAGQEEILAFYQINAINRNPRNPKTDFAP